MLLWGGLDFGLFYFVVCFVPFLAKGSAPMTFMEVLELGASADYIPMNY